MIKNKADVRKLLLKSKIKPENLPPEEISRNWKERLSLMRKR